MKARSARRRKPLHVVLASFALCALLAAAPSAAADPAQARKDLQATGVEDTPQAFAKVAGDGDMTAVRLFIDGREADVQRAAVRPHPQPQGRREDAGRRGREE